MKPRSVKLLPELDAKLVRYAELRGQKPEAVIAEAVWQFLRYSADLAIRIADARDAAEKALGQRR